MGARGDERGEGGLRGCVDEAGAEDKGAEGWIGGREREEGRFGAGFYGGEWGAESSGLVGGLDLRGVKWGQWLGGGKGRLTPSPRDLLAIDAGL